MPMRLTCRVPSLSTFSECDSPPCPWSQTSLSPHPHGTLRRRFPPFNGLTCLMLTPPPVDLRSDTLTQPTIPMRDAMASASVGDDVFGEDPTVNRLQEQVAAMFGKPRALFVPSGTMANQLALLSHCGRGDHVIVPYGAHILRYESGGGAALSGVQMLELGQGGVYDLGALRDHIQTLTPDHHTPPTRLITLENTHNREGGRVVPLSHIQDVCDLARERGVAVHMDGARIFNALAASGDAAKAVGACVDSLCFCLSKGLGAPVGSVLVGGGALIDRAHRYRKMLGGGMRQAGILAAAGLYALEHNVERLHDDHRRAKALAEGLVALPGISLDLATVQTNIVIFRTPDAAAFIAGVAAHGIKSHAIDRHRVRWVTHLHITDEDVSRALNAAHRVATA
jgi:threonine aldolase